MADWKDKFTDEGTFRGVPFQIESHQLKGGRRKQDREFAKREIGNSEDLGKKLKNFTLELFVFGDDYFDKRDALLEALDTEGPAALVHPYLGTKQVQAGNYTLSETVKEGRLARFSVEFSESGKVKFPDQVEDDLAGSIVNAASVAEDSRNFFEKAFDIANQAAATVQAAADGVAAIADFMEETVKKITGPIAAMTSAIRNLKADISDLIKLPGELADRIKEMFDVLLDEFSDDPETTARILGQFTTIGAGIDAGVADGTSNFFPPIPPRETPSRDRQRENETALINLAKEFALSDNAIATVQIDFISTKAALEAQTKLIEELDVQLQGNENIEGFEVVDDELFQSIKELQTSITRALPRTGTTELIEIIPIQTIPALVIAHDQFEDLDKENEIIDQNAIEHPGFVPGGDPIQVSAG